ncbi:sodium:calcium antiporter [Candidatus Amesbacteria bacterium]|nr:sodium:calcium antiporter [Candidatus Amesbacteria bacterium]
MPGPFLIFGASVVILLFSTRVFVSLSEKISKSLRISPLIVGVTIVALGTSLPELAVSTVAILKHDVGLAFGNIIGSNIVNILLVFPAGILIGKLRVGTTKTQRNAVLVLLITGLFALLHFLQLPPLFSGILLIILSFVITTVEYQWAKYGQNHEDVSKFKKYSTKRISRLDYLFLLLSLIGITAGGIFVVTSVEQISVLIGLSTTTLGLSLIAICTSLPELLTTIFSQEEHQEKLTIGNITGSNIYNLLFIGGLITLSSSASEIPLADWLWLIAATIIFSFTLKKYAGAVIPKKIGTVLLVLAVIYLLSLAKTF